MFVPALALGAGLTQVKNYVHSIPYKTQCPLTLEFRADITAESACVVKFVRKAISG